MHFSAYQIESLLENFQQNIFPMEKSVSDNLSLSENAVQDARQYFGVQKNPTLSWISPKEIASLVEDQTNYDPVVDYVQQSRAGRFVVPAYLPENPSPVFPLVKDHREAVKKNAAEKAVTQEISTDENDVIADFESAEYAQEIQSEETKISIPETDSSDESLENETVVKTAETINTPTEKPDVSTATLFEGIEDEDLDDEFDVDTNGLKGEIEDDSDVVFGEGRIELQSMIKFVSDYPDSSIKFLLRKNLDGRPLPSGYEEIYISWENRGLSRSRLKKYLFKLMEWNDFPDIPVLDVVRKIRERHYDLKEKIK